jgi:hypothetical protein
VTTSAPHGLTDTWDSGPSTQSCNYFGKIISNVIFSTPTMGDPWKKRDCFSKDAWRPKSQHNSSRVEPSTVVVTMTGSFVEEPDSLQEHGLRAVFVERPAVGIRPKAAVHHTEIITTKRSFAARGKLAPMIHISSRRFCRLIDS